MSDVSTIIEWYRPNPFQGLAWISFHSSILMLGGAIVMAFGRDVSGRVVPEIQPYCVVIGILLVIIGVSNACFRMYKQLSNQDVSLVLDISGLHYVSSESEMLQQSNIPKRKEVFVRYSEDEQQNEQSTLVELFIPWQYLEDVSYEKPTLYLIDHTQKIWKITHHFLGCNGQVLADRIKEIQKQVLIGVIS